MGGAARRSAGGIATMTATTSPIQPSPTESPAIHPRILSQLATITGSDFEHERARIAVQNASSTGADPLHHLV
jgi:hypothetical protein